MKRSNLTLIAALTLLGNLWPASGPEVLVVGDARPDTPTPLRPEPGKPVRYLLLGNVEMDLGPALGRLPRPDTRAMETELIGVLARQGFIRAKLGEPMPHVALAFSWGTARKDDMEEEDMFGINEMIYKLNRKEIWKLVGFDRSRNVSLVDGDKVDEAVISHRAYLMVVAFDLPALVKNKHVMLWRTRISIEATDHDLADSFPVMLASAAPWFGRTTIEPVFIDDRVRQTSVTLGELEVIGEVPEPVRKE